MCDSGFDGSFGGDGIGESLSDSGFDVGESFETSGELDSLDMNIETTAETLDVTSEPEILDELSLDQLESVETPDVLEVSSSEDSAIEMESQPAIENLYDDSTNAGELLGDIPTDDEIAEQERLEHEDLSELEMIDSELLESGGDALHENASLDGLGEAGTEPTLELQRGLEQESLSALDSVPDILQDADDSEGEAPLTLTRDITLEMLESRAEDTDAALENYRENLLDHDVSDEKIEAFIEQEREKINAEYESLDHGDTSSNIYYEPTDWESIAQELNGAALEEPEGDIHEQESAEELQELHEVTDSAIGMQNAEDPEQLGERAEEPLIDYESIYDSINSEALGQGFEGIQIDEDADRLDSALENFGESNWEGMLLDDQKASMQDLADYVVDIVGFDNPPAIEYYNNPREGDYGGYDPNTNTLNINEYMLYNSNEAADTIAHELWHAHQYECAGNPHSALDYQYQYNFDNYIKPEFGQEAYEAQLVEAEARAFAAQFKDRLSELHGRGR